MKPFQNHRPLRYGRAVDSQHIVIVGGGAAGFFAALAGAELRPDAKIVILEKSPQFLAKVKISGGGRCNVTHACFDPRAFAARFPRGEHALIGPLRQFPADDTVAWFARHGVQLKTEEDGRMFPVTDSSQTIVDCLLESARAAGVKLIANCGVEKIARRPDGRFEVMTARAGNGTRCGVPGDLLVCEKVLLSTGGCRTPALGQPAVSLGHTLEPPVPSLFTFHIDCPWLRDLSGISVETVRASIPEARLSECGPVLVTHWGVSGPVILRLSAWGARILHDRNYRFRLQINWLPHCDTEELERELESRRHSQPAKLVIHSPIAPLPVRLWAQLVRASGAAEDTRWSTLSRAARHKLGEQLLRSEFPVAGKSLNKDEFVTCGGVRLNEVDFKTMESKRCPGLFFAGEVLDIDGLTGGFNFQAAWTTGWIAGRAMAAGLRSSG